MTSAPASPASAALKAVGRRFMTSPAATAGSTTPRQSQHRPNRSLLLKVMLIRFDSIFCQGPDGELKALSKQDFKTALGGRYVEIILPNGKVQRRSAADVWLESSDRREVMGMQYCPNGIGLKPFHLNLCTRFGVIDPA